MKFNSAYNRTRPSVRCCSCKTQEEFIFDKVNNCLVKSGKTINTYERTQSHYEQCNINNQLRRYLVPGGSLPSRASADVDISQFPDSLIDFHAQNSVIAEKFNSLPAEFKQLFSNDVNSFVQALTENKLDNILAGYFSSTGTGTGAGAGETAGASSGVNQGGAE